MLEANDLSHKLWVEAINCDAYVQNRFPHKALDDKTPFEAWSGHKPNFSHFIVFGSKAWAGIPPEKRKELKPQINEHIMVGCSKYENGYNLFDRSSHKTFIERVVQFEEDPMQKIEIAQGECSNTPLHDDVSDDYSYDFHVVRKKQDLRAITIIQLNQQNKMQKHIKHYRETQI